MANGSVMGTQSGLKELLEAVRRRAEESGVFGAVETTETMVSAAAKASAEPAFYRIALEDGGLWVSLVTPARYLSQSIEADLVHTGDKLEDLVDEELVALGCERGPWKVEHFRSADLLYTFRSRLPIEAGEWGGGAAAKLAGDALLAYEAAFRELGDMESDGE